MSNFFDDLKQDMKDRKAKLLFCNEHKAEYNPGPDGSLIVVSPEELSETVQEKFCAMNPNRTLTFEVAPKKITLLTMETLLVRAQPSHIDLKPDLEHRTLVLETEGVDDSDSLWSKITDVLNQDGYFKSWQYVINGKVVQVLPKLTNEIVQNNLSKHTTINDGDVTDLKISLAKAQTVDDILKVMEGV
jgi:hypothetical protein